MYWLVNAVLIYDNIYYLLPFVLIGLPLLLGFFYGLMQLVNIFFWTNNYWRIFFFATIWTLFEFLRSIILTGLPWNLIAYSWSWSIYIMQSISIFGVYGLCFITLLTIGGIANFRFQKDNFYIFLMSILILFFIALFGFLRVSNYNETYSNNKKYRLITTNFNQKEKWLDESINQTMLLGSKSLMTFFPETSIGFSKKIPNNWMAGVIRKEGNKYYNSIQFNKQYHDKSKLVPFTEFLPYEKIIRVIDFKNLIPSNFFHSGDKTQDFDKNFLPLICYEGIFPSITLERFNSNYKAIVNISNDAWFGDGVGPKQQLTHVRYRSIETGLPLIRSANKGYSVLINPIGEIIHEMPINTFGYIDIKIPDKIQKTIYLTVKNYIILFIVVLFLFFRYIQKKLLYLQ